MAAGPVEAEEEEEEEEGEEEEEEQEEEQQQQQSELLQLLRKQTTKAGRKRARERETERESLCRGESGRRWVKEKMASWRKRRREREEWLRRQPAITTFCRPVFLSYRNLMAFPLCSFQKMPPLLCSLFPLSPLSHIPRSLHTFFFSCLHLWPFSLSLP